MGKIVQVRNLTKIYRKGVSETAVLQNVSFDLNAGEGVTIVGPSGSGKSTLLHILGGLDNPTSGEVKVEGRILSKMPDEELSEFRSRKIGFVFQFFHLQDYLTAEENILLPSKMTGRRDKHASAKAKELLDLVGLGHRAKHYPSEMSGGEMQRVAIARALINDPKLILADEPTGNLDKENTNIVMETFEKVSSRGVSVILATHDPRCQFACVDHRHRNELLLEKGVLKRAGRS